MRKARKGAPINAVTTPTGSSVGEKKVLAAVSHSVRRTPPTIKLERTDFRKFGPTR
jgi:hypothetical protein